MNNDNDAMDSRIVVEVDDNNYVTKDKLLKYFGKRRNGGGDIKSLIYPYLYQGHRVAVIEFEDNKCGQSLIATSADIIVGVSETVRLRIGKFEEYFTSGLIQMNRCLYEKLQSTFADELSKIQEECDVEIDRETCSMKGEWYKMYHAKAQIDALLYKDQVKEAVPAPTKSSFCDIHRVSDHTGVPDSVASICEEPANVSTSVPATKDRLCEDETEAPFSGSNNLASIDNEVEISLCVEVDYHLLEYIKLVRTDDMKNFVMKYTIQEERRDNVVMCTFSRSEVAAKGKMLFEDFIKQLSEASVTKKFDPIGSTDNMINLAIERVRDRFKGTVYVCIVHEGDSKRVLFIGPMKEMCDTAVSVFRSALSYDSFSGERKYNGNISASNDLTRYSFCDDKLLLLVVQGNIADQDTSAIVNAANKDLHDGGGVTGAIFDAGGKEFRKRCKAIMKQRDHDPLAIGEVLESKACGKLRCASVLHAVAPKYHECDDKAECQSKMDLVCCQILQAADTNQFHSISIPAMGTGIYGVPIDLFCKAMLHGLGNLCEDVHKGQSKHLKEIRIVNYDKYEAKEIASCIAREIQNQPRLQEYMVSNG